MSHQASYEYRVDPEPLPRSPIRLWVLDPLRVDFPGIGGGISCPNSLLTPVSCRQWTQQRLPEMGPLSGVTLTLYSCICSSQLVAGLSATGGDRSEPRNCPFSGMWEPSAGQGAEVEDHSGLAGYALVTGSARLECLPDSALGPFTMWRIHLCLHLGNVRTRV